MSEKLIELFELCTKNKIDFDYISNGSDKNSIIYKGHTCRNRQNSTGLQVQAMPKRLSCPPPQRRALEECNQ